MVQQTTSLFTFHDPFVEILLGSQAYKTKKSKEGGQTPTWTESFKTNIDSSSKFTFNIFNNKIIGKHDLIGGGQYEFEYDLGNMTAQNPSYEKIEDIPILRKNNHVGTIKFKFEFKLLRTKKPQSKENEREIEYQKQQQKMLENQIELMKQQRFFMQEQHQQQLGISPNFGATQIQFPMEGLTTPINMLSSSFQQPNQQMLFSQQMQMPMQQQFPYQQQQIHQFMPGQHLMQSQQLFNQSNDFQQQQQTLQYASGQQLMQSQQQYNQSTELFPNRIEESNTSMQFSQPMSPLKNKLNGLKITSKQKENLISNLLDSDSEEDDRENVHKQQKNSVPQSMKSKSKSQKVQESEDEESSSEEELVESDESDENGGENSSSEKSSSQSSSSSSSEDEKSKSKSKKKK